MIEYLQYDEDLVRRARRANDISEGDRKDIAFRNQVEGWIGVAFFLMNLVLCVGSLFVWNLITFVLFGLITYLNWRFLMWLADVQKKRLAPQRDMESIDDIVAFHESNYFCYHSRTPRELNDTMALVRKCSVLWNRPLSHPLDDEVMFNPHDPNFVPFSSLYVGDCIRPSETNPGYYDYTGYMVEILRRYIYVALRCKQDPRQINAADNIITCFINPQSELFNPFKPAGYEIDPDQYKTIFSSALEENVTQTTWFSACYDAAYKKVMADERMKTRVPYENPPVPLGNQGWIFAANCTLKHNLSRERTYY